MCPSCQSGVAAAGAEAGGVVGRYAGLGWAWDQEGRRDEGQGAARLARLQLVAGAPETSRAQSSKAEPSRAGSAAKLAEKRAPRSV